MCRYGINNFSRNAWLTIAATAVMTITLLIILTSVIAHKVLTDTISNLRNQVDMSIYLKTETTDEVGQQLVDQVKQLPSVQNARYISAEEGRQQFINDNRHDVNLIEAAREAINVNPATLRVVLIDINDTEELQNFVNTNQLVKDNIDPNREPSFAGERRTSIETIGRIVTFAQNIGIIAGSVFVVISSLIIFNTIRMAIFNRREEIQMMKLIGAEKSFIRGPFVVEAIVYGFFAALIATTLAFIGIYSLSESLSSFQIVVQPTIDLATHYIGFVVLGTILIGAVIGVISSWLATHRYLKL